MTEELLVALLAVATGTWIARPLLKGRRALRSFAGPNRTADLLERKQSIYRTIVDLEMDHEMGKIDDADYEQLKQQSKTEAVGIIRELEGQASSELEHATLEDEIQTARARLRKR